MFGRFRFAAAVAFGIFLLLLPAAVQAQAPACMPVTRPLDVGSRGEDVANLQTFLAGLPGIYPQGLVTGYFGILTHGAVERFQLANQIVASDADPGYGHVGPKTRASLACMQASDPAAPDTPNNPPVVEHQPLIPIGSPFAPTGYVPGFGGGGSSAATEPAPAPADATPPALSALSAGMPATATATITWTTDEPASTRLEFGTSTAYGSTTPLVSTLSTSHSVALTGLVAATTYHYAVISADAKGNTATSTDKTFTTDALALNSRAVFLGDSITAGSSGLSYIFPSMMYAGGRFYAPPDANQGIGGNTTAQMLARIASSTDLLPKVLVVLGGTNDITGLSSTAAEIESNLRGIYDAAEAAGSQVVAVTITPRNDSSWENNPTAYEAVRTAVNIWIKSQSDVKAVDMDAAGFDPSTMTLEGLHPNRVGAYLIGQEVGGAMASLADTGSMLYVDPSDWDDLLDDNDLAGTAGSKAGVGGNVSGDVATGWHLDTNVGGITVVGSKTTTSDGYVKQVITISGTATSTGTVTFYRNQPYSGVAGDVYDMWANVSLSGLSGAVKGFFTSSDGTLTWEPSASATSTTEFSGVVRGVGSALTATDTNNRVQFGLFISPGPVSATLSVSQPTWRKVPAGQ